MKAQTRPLAIVTGASSGIGLELARLAGLAGHDLLIASRTARIDHVTDELRATGAATEAVETDLSTTEGVDALIAALGDRDVDLLCANAGHGLGRGFLDQPFHDLRHVIDTNVTGTVYLLHCLGQRMRTRKQGRILITGSVAGFIPGSFQAVYNASKAFIDSFAAALRNELKDSGVVVTCLLPGATDTAFFEKADMLDTRIGTQPKANPADVAKVGFDAVMAGKPSVVFGFMNKAQVAMSGLLPQELLAELHRFEAAPRDGKIA